MGAPPKRLVEPSNIPACLWDSTHEKLKLPPFLATTYKRLIGSFGLEELARSARNSRNPPVGGLTQEATDKHFAQAFDGSVARAELAMLDPKGVSPATSNALLKRLSGNGVSLTDAPCGAGAAALSFLATIAQLRACNVLPRVPLRVALIGAELSDPARVYAARLLDKLRSTLCQQAIFVKEDFVRWDVTDDLSNTDLIRKMTINSAAYINQLIVVANFNGFLEKERKREDARPRLAELFRHASGDHSTAVWIEPKMNRAINSGGLFPWLRSLLKSGWRRFARESSEHPSDPIATCVAKFELPLKPGEFARVGLAVMPIALARCDE